MFPETMLPLIKYHLYNHIINTVVKLWLVKQNLDSSVFTIVKRSEILGIKDEWVGRMDGFKVPVK